MRCPDIEGASHILLILLIYFCLTFRKLEAAVGFRAAVILTLDDTGVTDEETAGLEHLAKLRLVVG
jgi:hypothetical protein